MQDCESGTPSPAGLSPFGAIAQMRRVSRETPSRHGQTAGAVRRMCPRPSSSSSGRTRFAWRERVMVHDGSPRRLRRLTQFSQPCPGNRRSSDGGSPFDRPKCPRLVRRCLKRLPDPLLIDLKPCLPGLTASLCAANLVECGSMSGVLWGERSVSSPFRLASTGHVDRVGQ